MTPERLRELADHFRSECCEEGACAVCDEIHAYLIGTVKESLTDGKAPSEATGIYESAWVIEGMWSSAAYPEYWVGSSAWSSDPYKALRFASKESAQQAADMMLVGINHRVACHEFAGNSHHE